MGLVPRPRAFATKSLTFRWFSGLRPSSIAFFPTAPLVTLLNSPMDEPPCCRESSCSSECDSSDMRLPGRAQHAGAASLRRLPPAGEALGCGEDGVEGRAVTDVVQQNQLAVRP